MPGQSFAEWYYNVFLPSMGITDQGSYVDPRRYDEMFGPVIAPTATPRPIQMPGLQQFGPAMSDLGEVVTNPDRWHPTRPVVPTATAVPTAVPTTATWGDVPRSDAVLPLYHEPRNLAEVMAEDSFLRQYGGADPNLYPSDYAEYAEQPTYVPVARPAAVSENELFPVGTAATAAPVPSYGWTGRVGWQPAAAPVPRLPGSMVPTHRTPVMSEDDVFPMGTAATAPSRSAYGGDRGWTGDVGWVQPAAPIAAARPSYTATPAPVVPVTSPTAQPGRVYMPIVSQGPTQAAAQPGKVFMPLVSQGVSAPQYGSAYSLSSAYMPQKGAPKTGSAYSLSSAYMPQKGAPKNGSAYSLSSAYMPKQAALPTPLKPGDPGFVGPVKPGTVPPAAKTSTGWGTMPNAPAAAAKKPAATSAAPAGPALPSWVDRNWYNAFKAEHGGAPPEQVYKSDGPNALHHADFDRQWGEQFAKMYGRPPSEHDWKASYYQRQSAYYGD